MTWVIAVQFSDDQPVRLYVRRDCDRVGPGYCERIVYDITTSYDAARRFSTEAGAAREANRACFQISPKLAQFLRPERAFS